MAKVKALVIEVACSLCAGATLIILYEAVRGDHIAVWEWAFAGLYVLTEVLRFRLAKSKRRVSVGG